MVFSVDYEADSAMFTSDEKRWKELHSRFKVAPLMERCLSAIVSGKRDSKLDAMLYNAWWIFSSLIFLTSIL